jgi:AcrR family transcriptional regulator
VYSHFPSKEELFRAVVTHEAEALRPELPTAMAETEEKYRVQLIDFGASLIRLLTTPSIIGLGRLMISECVRHPEMATEFYLWGPSETHRKLAELLEYGREQHWLGVHCDALKAAHHLLSLWQGQWLFRQQLGLTGPMSRRQATDHATQCVDVFLLAFSRR